jgi:hypothetical protein
MLETSIVFSGGVVRVTWTALHKRITTLTGGALRTNKPNSQIEHAHSILSCIFLFGLSHAFSAPFVNLGFDEANTNNVSFTAGAPYPTGDGPITDLLPGWSLFHDGTPLTSLILNSFPFGAGEYATLLARGDPPATGFEIEGPYALRLNGGYRLLQEGDVPEGAQLIGYSFFSSYVPMSVNGEALPTIDPFYVVSGQRATNYLDISKYAGQTVQLEFGVGTFDSIFFVVPEPSTYALFGVGGFVFSLSWIRRRLRR